MFQLDSLDPQPGDTPLWPSAGHFAASTVRTDIPISTYGYENNPWTEHCEVMSDNVNYCWEPWEWCIDLNDISDGCYPDVVCGDMNVETPMEYTWPAGCEWAEVDWILQLVCDCP